MLFYELYLSFLYNINDSYNFHRIFSALFLIMNLTDTITRLKDICTIHLIKICLSFYNV